MAQFQKLTAEARSLLESDSASVLVDKVVWSGVLLIVVFFGSLLVYRVVVTRLGKTPPPDSVADPAPTEPGS